MNKDKAIRLLVAKRNLDGVRGIFWGYMGEMPFSWRLEWTPLYRLNIRGK